MTRPRSARAARLLWSCVVFGWVLIMVLIALPRSAPVDSLFVLPRLAGSVLLLSTGTVGALVIARRPKNPIGWILCFAALVWDVGALATEYAIYAVVERPGVLPAGAVASWIATWALLPAGLCLLFVLFLFPNGRLPSPRWRPVAWAAAAGGMLWTVGVAFTPGTPNTTIFVAPRAGFAEVGTAFSTVLSDIGGVITVACGVMAVASLVLRTRAAQGVERQQLKWFAFGASIVVLTTGAMWVAILLFGVSLSSLTGQLIGTAGTVALVALPLTTALAILRYRLFDIDLIINRTLVYGSLTLILGTLFVGMTALTQAAFQAAWGQRADLFPVVVGVGVALSFQRLRQRMQSAVDHVLPAREERALLFTDIVGSTELLAKMGDARWREQLDRYRASVRRELKRFGGTEMHIAGDSFFATFTDPTRAVDCAKSLVPVLRALGIPSRFGIHWGACEMRGEEVSGLAVWAAARVMSTAGSDEIVVSDALRDVVSGAGIRFEEHGVHTLKGLPGEWRLHSLIGINAMAD